MKKTILAAITLLISCNLFACHVNSLGWCGGEAYFKTQKFDNNSIFEFRYYEADTVLFTYQTKATGNTDTTFSLPQPIQGYPIRLQFRYKAIGSSHFNSWGNNGDLPNYFQSSTSQLPGCSVLAVSFSNVSAVNNNGELTVNFRNEDESNVSHYDIYLSKDAVHWDKVKEVPVNGSHSYTVGIGLSAFAFLFPFLIWFKKKKYYLPFAIIASVILFSCQKDSIVSSHVNEYRYAKVQPVTLDGTIALSTGVLTFKK